MFGINVPACLESLCHRLTHAFRSKDKATEVMINVADVLSSFGKPGVYALVNDLLNSSCLLNNIAKNSYLHQNGFYKIQLAACQDFTVRLHIWMPGNHAKETLHSHCWHFASYVLDGMVISEEWEDSPSSLAKPYDEYLYLSKHEPPRLIGQAKVAFSRACHISEGSSYFLKATTLHKVVTENDNMTATIICHSSPVTSFARNIILNNKVPDVRPRYLSSAELAKVLLQYSQKTTIKECAHDCYV